MYCISVCYEWLNIIFLTRCIQTLVVINVLDFKVLCTALFPTEPYYSNKSKCQSFVMADGLRVGFNFAYCIVLVIRANARALLLLVV